MITITHSALSTLRAKEHNLINTQIGQLAREYPHATVGELYDCIIEARYDLETAREFCQEALRQELQLSAFLAQKGNGHVG